jgi:hypothetical protein
VGGARIHKPGGLSSNGTTGASRQRDSRS